MTEELWSECQSGTLDRIARTQRNRSQRRVWLARSLTGFLILLIPSIAAFAYMSATSISCQQAVAWFDSARGGKLTSSENRSFKFHLLTCSKCRQRYAQFHPVAQNPHHADHGRSDDQAELHKRVCFGCPECNHCSSTGELSNPSTIVFNLPLALEPTPWQ